MTEHLGREKHTSDIYSTDCWVTGASGWATGCAHPSLGFCPVLGLSAPVLLCTRPEWGWEIPAHLSWLAHAKRASPLHTNPQLCFFSLTAARKGCFCLLQVFSKAGECFSQWPWQVYDTDHDILVAANREDQTRDINSNYKIFYESIVKYSKFGSPFS